MPGGNRGRHERCYFREPGQNHGMAGSTQIAAVLAEVGPRLRRLREQRGVTLTGLAATTGISKSTLSRLESGQRKPSLELLLPIAEAHRVPLDDLVGAPEVGDPRIRLRPKTRNGRVVVPLTEQAGGMHAWKVVIPPQPGEPELRIHHGYEWLCVLSGQMRLILGNTTSPWAPAKRPSSTRSSRTGSAPPPTARRDPQPPQQPRQTLTHSRSTQEQEGQQLTEGRCSAPPGTGDETCRPSEGIRE